MESVLEFINMNYIWLIIIAVIILLALVGYIADKQGFSNNLKNKSDKKKKIDDSKDDDSKLLEIDKNLKQEDKKINLDNENLNIENKEELTDDYDYSLMEEELEEIDEPLIEDLPSIDENNDLNSENIELDDDLNIDDDFNKVLDDVENTSSSLDVKIPNEVDDEEDIWKF